MAELSLGHQRDLPIERQYRTPVRGRVRSIPFAPVADAPHIPRRRPSAAVLIPIKSFDLAKGRLRDTLDPGQRSALARSMAGTVIAAAGPLTVWVVCGDPEVASFATSLGANVLWRAPRGLNHAVSEGRTFLAGLGYERIVVAHADLPLARDIAWLADGDGVILVSDRRNDGSNVISVPTGLDFTFAYGPGSAAAHRAEAERLGVRFDLVSDEALGWDIDVPDDLAVVQHLLVAPDPPDQPLPRPPESS